MIQKDVCKYVASLYKDNYMESITLLSKPNNGKSLVEDERCEYNFDNITKAIYSNRDVPASADALFVSDKIVLFTEFKTGFKRKITYDNLDYSKLSCPKFPNITCDEYGKLLIDKSKLEVSELLDSLKFKAIESYITLEKYILPHCLDISEKRQRVVFCVVIDDVVDDLEDGLLELSNEISENNSFSNVKSSLERFVSVPLNDDDSFFYDEVIVKSPYDYKKYISKFMDETK